MVYNTLLILFHNTHVLIAYTSHDPSQTNFVIFLVSWNLVQQYINSSEYCSL